jgi:ent-kaurene oxidase
VNTRVSSKETWPIEGLTHCPTADIYFNGSRPQLDKTPFFKLLRLNSCMWKWQRVNPSTPPSMHHVLLQKAELSDGTVLPKRAHNSIAVNAIQNGFKVTPDPENSTAFQYYNLRQGVGQAYTRECSMTQNRILNFGHSSNVCPRWFCGNLETRLPLCVC